MYPKNEQIVGLKFARYPVKLLVLPKKLYKIFCFISLNIYEEIKKVKELKASCCEQGAFFLHKFYAPYKSNKLFLILNKLWKNIPKIFFHNNEIIF